MAQDTRAFTHVMVDLETLGTKPGCSVASIGAVAFDPLNGVIGPSFSSRISLVSCENAGLRIEAGTLRWWLDQSEAARRDTFLGQVAPLERVIRAFGDWWAENAVWGGTRLWSHGATFDPGIIEHAYSVIGERVPWKFADVRDTRTIFDLAGINLAEFRDDKAVHHSAHSDAMVQATAVIAAYQKLGLREAPHVD